MALEFLPQCHYLFDAKWDAEKDVCFMNLIISDVELNPMEMNANIPIASLRRARRGLNERYYSIYSWDDVCNRYAKLKDRYRTFKALISHPGVFWDELTNVVHANDVIWAQFCEKYELATAYYYCGEKVFDVLTKLFETEDNKEFSWEKVIDDDKVRTQNEVTSPLLIQNARRRLFHDAAVAQFNFSKRTPRKPDFNLLGPLKEDNSNLGEEESRRTDLSSCSSSSNLRFRY